MKINTTVKVKGIPLRIRAEVTPIWSTMEDDPYIEDVDIDSEIVVDCVRKGPRPVKHIMTEMAIVEALLDSPELYRAAEIERQGDLMDAAAYRMEVGR